MRRLIPGSTRSWSCWFVPTEGIGPGDQQRPVSAKTLLESAITANTYNTLALYQALSESFAYLHIFTYIYIFKLLSSSQQPFQMKTLRHRKVPHTNHTASRVQSQSFHPCCLAPRLQMPANPKCFTSTQLFLHLHPSGPVRQTNTIKEKSLRFSQLKFQPHGYKIST